ncbi:D-glycerate dehydrogenase [Limibaculum sp. M0105]|uniref:D-glycerate dehydrogenase n=1 Tax=Thermohalobaculum xanthum TaxID=2753746 RepID=A0A8J7M7P6_9RHOB|nr:D-glycerate dehydrogenase [Thermohalobaculum xanthum]MBK0399831.1 D-glycerate dehydrogenase [Thermohalobaculum xanthum]
MAKPRVICTRKWPDRVEAELKARFDVTLNEADVALTQDELRAAFDDYDAVCTTVTDRVDAAVMAAPKRARLIAQFGVGFNNIDTEAARKASLAVTNTPGVLTDATADIALTLLLNVARRTYEGETMLRAGEWTGWRPTQLMGTSPQGKTLGIIGMGRIGKAMAKRCYHALDMRIVFYDAFPVSDAGVPAEQLGTVEEVLAVSDFVSLHCPGGGENVHLINAERLAAMKKGAILVNSARGDIIDEAALVASLRSGHLGGAGLDVFEREPKVAEALTSMRNVCLLPHLGSATIETREAMGMTVLANLTAYFEGRDLPNRVV